MLKMYGYHLDKDGTATLSLMTDVGKGNGDLNPHTGNRGRWQTEDVKTGSREDIVRECARLNRAISKGGQ